jgi:maltooligosyltrehalose trehalohydrolase
MTALLLLGPATPMLFQGQEYGASTPFFYFADHQGDLAERVAKGRRRFLSQFAALVHFNLLDQEPAPHDAATFARSKLSLQERTANAECTALHHDLLTLRKEDPAFDSLARRGLDGAVLGPDAFVLRYFVDPAVDRLLIVNFGREIRLREAPEPLLAPPENAEWSMLWSSEDGRYGGSGHAPLESEKGWHIPGEAAVLLSPMK